MRKVAEIYSLDYKKIKKDLNIKVGPENKNIIQKENRPFYLEISISDSYSAYIPIRTNLPHKYGFVTKRANQEKSGLDYSKAYIVLRERAIKYQDKVKTISSAEYRKINNNQSVILNDFKKFLIEINDKIINYNSLNFSEKRKVDFSSLQYQKESLRECVKEIVNSGCQSRV